MIVSGVIIITGSGQKLFSAGADINEFDDLRKEKKFKIDGRLVYFKVEEYPKIIIAAIQGGAYGGGLELAMSCHLRIMSESTTVGLPEVKLGMIPAWGGTQRLPRYVGKCKALEMMLMGDFISAQEALALGLVNKIVPADKVLDEAKAMAKRLAGGAPVAQREILKAVRLGLETNLRDAIMQSEDASVKVLLESEDFAEGSAAFLEKRPAVFKGK